MADRKIWAAHAISEKRVAISVGELRHEDPFSNLLLYDEDFEGLWGYVELPRTIASITSHHSDSAGKDVFVALSDEGDVYFIEGDVPLEKIPGAGVLSEDAESLGAMNFIQNEDGILYACGNGSQVYSRRGKDDWISLWDARRPDARKMSFLGMTALASGQGLVLCGFLNTSFKEPTREEAAQIQRARESGNKREYKRVLRQFKTLEAKAAGCLCFLEDGRLRESELPSDQYINAVVRGGKHAIVAVGSGGTIVAGDNPDTLEDFSDPDLKEKFRGVHVGRDGAQILGDDAVHRFSPEFELEESLPLPDEIGSPLGISVFEWGFWCFGHSGLARYRKGKWEPIAIPEERWNDGG